MKKENKFKLYTLTTLAAMTLSLPALADGLSYDMDVDIMASRVTMDVSAEAGDIITVLVLPETITLEQLAQDPAQNGAGAGYVRNLVIGEDKKASISFPIDSGKYTLNIASQKTDDVISRKLLVPAKSDYETLINLVKAQDKTQFASTVKIESNKALLGFDIDIYSDKAVERLFDEYKNSLSVDDYDANLDAFKKCAVIEAVNAGRAFDTIGYIKELYKQDTVLMSYIDKHITTAEAEAEFNARMESASAKNILNIADLLITVNNSRG